MAPRTKPDQSSIPLTFSWAGDFIVVRTQPVHKVPISGCDQGQDVLDALHLWHFFYIDVGFSNTGGLCSLDGNCPDDEVGSAGK
jgi:hypothetical protein